MRALFLPRSPLRPDRPPLPEAKFLNAMAVVAVGMFIGAWVIGPVISHDSNNHEALRSSAEERAMINAGMARPDPFPYRTRTPAFEAPGVSHYADDAKEKALAALGRRPRGSHDAVGTTGSDVGDTASADDLPWPDRRPQQEPRRVPRYDRHTGVTY